MYSFDNLIENQKPYTLVAVTRTANGVQGHVPMPIGVLLDPSDKVSFYPRGCQSSVVARADEFGTALLTAYSH